MPSTLDAIPSGIIWKPPHLQQAHENGMVQRIHAVCYHPHAVDDPPTKVTNHWVFFLQLSNSQSIRVNPSPVPVTNNLQLHLEHKQYAYTNTGLIVRTMIPVEGLTVKHFCDFIQNIRFDRYIFDREGNGCRYWVTRFLSYLKQTGNVQNSEEVDNISRILARTWTEDPTTRKPREVSPPRGTPANPGTFY